MGDDDETGQFFHLATEENPAAKKRTAPVTGRPFQYSLASMMVSTRCVTIALAGFSDPRVSVGS